MALAKQLLRGGELATAEVAERASYGSASTFARRSAGTWAPPGKFARMH